MTLREANADRERRDLVTRQVMDDARLIRFVAGPDGSVVPDLGRRLPGRGLWVEATRDAVAEAARRNLFSQAAKTRLTAAPDLADRVGALLAKRCLEQLGLARREGALISGFEKSAAAVRSGRAAWVIEAADGSADGRSKILALARHQPGLGVCGAFTAEELRLALGLENAIHAVLLAGGRAERWTLEVGRLAGFRPIRPPAWDRRTEPAASDAGSGDKADETLGGRGSVS